MVQGPGVATTGTRAAADEGGEDRSGGSGKGGSGEAAAPASGSGSRDAAPPVTQEVNA